MDFTDQAIIYALMIIPTFFALTVVGQGVAKISRNDDSGKVVLVFGLSFLGMIVATYFLFIQ